MRAPRQVDRRQAGATNLAVLLLAFLAGVLGGVLATTLMAPRPAADGPDAGAGVARALTALDETVARLGEQVERLGRDGLPQPAAPARPLGPTAEPPPDLAPLVAGVQQLAEAVRAQATRPDWGGRSPALAAPMLSVPAAPPPLQLLEPLVRGEARDVLRQHLFWSYQQLLDTYGVPELISISDGYVTWQYETEGGNYVGFRLFDGMVMDYWN